MEREKEREGELGGREWEKRAMALGGRGERVVKGMGGKEGMYIWEGGKLKKKEKKKKKS